MFLNSLTINENSDSNKKPRCLWLMRVCECASVVPEGFWRTLSIKFNVAFYSSKLIISIELLLKKIVHLATR